MKPVEAILIGAGLRGQEAIGNYALQRPDELRFIAVAEPSEPRRKRFAKSHAIPEENCFADWRQILDRPRMADVCFNTTMDRTHRESAIAALRAGYHLFLEKPMADTPDGCLEIERTALQERRLLQVCHPLRYTPFYLKVRELLDSGIIGRVVSLTMVENVAFWHFAHSYVRGNWRRVDESGPTILTKCCHDMDIATWLVDSRVKKVSSVGSLRFFHEGNAPTGAPARCTDGCPVEATCPYFAPAFYLGPAGRMWPVTQGLVADTQEARLQALRTEQYGRCVFQCDNTAVDDQGVVAEFVNGVVFNFSLHANTVSCFRTIRVIGEKGELNGNAEKREIRVTRFSQGYADEAVHEIHQTIPGHDAHGGGDSGAIANFLRLFRSRNHEEMALSLKIAVEGHLLAFAAEQARAHAAVIAMDEFRHSHGS